MDQLLDALRAMRRDLGLEASLHAPYTQIEFDDECVSLHGRNVSGIQAPRVQFAWTAIRRVCFKDNGPMASDVLYVMTADSDRTFAIPLEAVGGGDFWRQLRTRGVFPAALHEQATLAMDGRFYCWPPAARDAPDAS
jgi:hypothetical protein